MKSVFFGFVRPDGSRVELTVQKEEYINVTAGTEHWFYLTNARRVKAVRYFTGTQGWIPMYSDQKLISSPVKKFIIKTAASSLTECKGKKFQCLGMQGAESRANASCQQEHLHVKKLSNNRINAHLLTIS